MMFCSPHEGCEGQRTVPLAVSTPGPLGLQALQRVEALDAARPSTSSRSCATARPSGLDRRLRPGRNLQLIRRPQGAFEPAAGALQICSYPRMKNFHS